MSDLGELTELIEAVGAIALNSEKIANSITPLSAAPAQDATGGNVASLTEAVMGMTHALSDIAEAIRDCSHTVANKRFV